MAQARVQLKEGSTYSFPDGTMFVHGQPKVITDEKLLALIRSSSRFHVTELPVAVSKEEVQEVPSEPETGGSAEAVPAMEPEAKLEKPAPKTKRRVGRPRKKKPAD